MSTEKRVTSRKTMLLFIAFGYVAVAFLSVI